MDSQDRFSVLNLPSLAWPSDLSIPLKRFRLFVAADARNIPVDVISAFVTSALGKGAVYFCVWGPDCGRFHDIVDEVILGDDLGNRKFAGPDGSSFVMTTWHEHEKLEEALGFFAKFAHPVGAFERDSQYWLALSIGNASSAASIRQMLESTELA